MLEAPAYNAHVILLKDPCVSSTQPNKTISDNDRLFPSEKPKFLEEFLSKLSQFSQGKNVLDATPSNTDDYLLSDICISSSHLNRPIWNKQSLTPP
jgi:hypothetical protein